MRVTPSRATRSSTQSVGMLTTVWRPNFDNTVAPIWRICTKVCLAPLASTVSTSWTRGASAALARFPMLSWAATSCFFSNSRAEGEIFVCAAEDITKARIRTKTVRILFLFIVHSFKCAVSFWLRCCRQQTVLFAFRWICFQWLDPQPLRESPRASPSASLGYIPEEVLCSRSRPYGSTG